MDHQEFKLLHDVLLVLFYNEKIFCITDCY